MCFGATHACTITCINDILNESALAVGNVSGQHIAGTCKIACAAGVAIEDTGAAVWNDGIIPPPFAFVALLLIVLTALAFAVYIGTRKEKDEL